MKETSNPFESWRPSADSPLSQTQREHYPSVAVVNVEEQRRSEGVIDDMQSGRLAPIFDPVPTPPPFEPTTPVGRFPKR